MDICNAVFSGFNQTADHAAVLELTNSVTSCLQWDAIWKAGAKQAKAARYAGTMTFWSGVFAFCAAIVIATIAYRGVLSQIKFEHSSRADQRVFEVKRETYLQVCDALFAGVTAIARGLDHTLKTEDVLANYQSKMSYIARIHMTADVDTVKAVLNCVMSLIGPHVSILKRHQRLINTQQVLSDSDLRNLAGEALNDLATLQKPFSTAVVKLRAELGFHINQCDYEEMVEQSIKDAITIVKISLKII